MTDGTRKGGVMYPCKFCGQINLSTWEPCPGCGRSTPLLIRGVSKTVDALVRAGTVLVSITAEPKGSTVLILARWGDQLYVVNAHGGICGMTLNDVMNHWGFLPPNDKV